MTTCLAQIQKRREEKTNWCEKRGKHVLIGWGAVGCEVCTVLVAAWWTCTGGGCEGDIVELRFFAGGKWRPMAPEWRLNGWWMGGLDDDESMGYSRTVETLRGKDGGVADEGGDWKVNQLGQVNDFQNQVSSSLGCLGAPETLRPWKRGASTMIVRFIDKGRTSGLYTVFLLPVLSPVPSR